PGRARIDGVVTRDRQSACEEEREGERGYEQPRSLEQPRQVDERSHEGEAERHRHERLAVARAARDRREVAVEELAERQLQHVLAAEQEGGDPDLEHADEAGGGEEQQTL